MSRALRLLPRVEAELGEAIEWYEARRVGLGAELLEAAARAFVRIQEAPHQLARWRVGRRDYSRFVLGRFPYVVLLHPRRVQPSASARALKRSPAARTCAARLALAHSRPQYRCPRSHRAQTRTWTPHPCLAQLKIRYRSSSTTGAPPANFWTSAASRSIQWSPSRDHAAPQKARTSNPGFRLIWRARHFYVASARPDQFGAVFWL